MSLLLNHLVSTREQHRRHSQADCLGGLEIHDQFEFGWLLDGQVAGLGALENFVDENRCAAIEVGIVYAE